jgi:beta-lactamase class C
MRASCVRSSSTANETVAAKRFECWFATTFMRSGRLKRCWLIGLLVALLTSSDVLPRESAVAAPHADLRSIVTDAVRPIMTQYGIPGMAVGVTVGGRSEIFDYGVASKATGKRVDPSTLFEIGSITKTFTASLVSYAQLTGVLSLSDESSLDFPPLRGTAFDRVRLVNLGTHTAGGLPLQFPDEVHSDADAIAYYQHWKPLHPAGTYRQYSNPSIMLLGLIAAKRMGAPFSALMQRKLFAPLGLHNTFLAVPQDQFARYAQGYTADGAPRRLTPGPLAPQAYGIRTTAADLLRFVGANMGALHLNPTLRRAITDTHIGYYRIGPLTQDLIWEQYRYPTPLRGLLQGNSDQIVFDDNLVAPIDPPSRPQLDVMLNKTGSTNGFGAYVMYVPRRKTAVVLLANRSYPIEARVAAAYRILMRLRAADGQRE